MSSQLSISRSYQVGGKQFNENRTFSADTVFCTEVQCLAAQPATLTTRTDNTDGTLTMTNSMHGITTDSIIDIYWVDTNGNQHVQANVTVGAVSDTSVPFSGGTDTGVSSILPAAMSVVSVGIRINVPCAITGNNVTAILADGDNGGVIDILSSAPAELLTIFGPIVAAPVYEWDTSCGQPNPLAGVTIASISFSNSDITGAQNLRVALMQS